MTNRGCMTDRPLFRNVDQALKWAFQTREARPMQPCHVLVPFMKKDRLGDDVVTDTPLAPVDPGLDRVAPGLDQAAQAGMLQSFCRRQQTPRCLHLLAKYARGEERNAARRALRDFLMPLITHPVAPKYVVYQLLARYYGRREVNLRELAGRLTFIPQKDGETKEKYENRLRYQVRSLARDVDSWLKQVSTQTEEAAHDELKKMGVIG